MSYFYYMACSRALKTGFYAAPPKRIYPCYAAYMESDDYQRFEFNRTSRGYTKPNPDMPRDPGKAVGLVHVFEHFRDNHCVGIYPFPLPSECTKDDEFIASQFTLPHLYQVDQFAPDLLCKYLHPNDRLEFLSVFLDHGEPPRPPVTGSIDLQDFADEKLHMEDIYDITSNPTDNTLFHVLPPCTPQMHFRIEPVDFSEIIYTVHLDNADDYWNRKELRRQGLL